TEAPNLRHATTLLRLVILGAMAGLALSSVVDGTRGVSNSFRFPCHRHLLVKPKASRPRRDTQYPRHQGARQDLETQPRFRRATIKMIGFLVMRESVCTARSF